MEEHLQLSSSSLEYLFGLPKQQTTRPSVSTPIWRRVSARSISVGSLKSHFGLHQTLALVFCDMDHIGER